MQLPPEDEEILNTDPDKITHRECMIFRLDPELKKAYEEKWGTQDVCKDK